MSAAAATLSLNATQFEAALAQAGARLDEFGGKVSSAFGGSVIAQLAAVTAGVVGVTGAFSLMRGALSGGVELNSSLEQTRLALATLLGQFEGDRFGDFNSRAREAGNILEMLREKGKYAEATFANLADTLQMTAGTFFSEGIKGAEDQADMIVAVSQALAAYGGDQASLTSEVTSLLRGQVRAWDRVARGAGITAEELKKAKDEGQLFQYVMGKLSAVTADAEQGMDTFASVVTMNREELDNLKTQLAAPMFEVLKEGLKSLNESLSSEEFAESIKEMSYQISLVVEGGVKMLASLMKALPTLIEVGKTASMVLVPALVMLIARKLAVGAASSAMAARVGLSLASMQTAFTAAVTKIKYSITELQYNMLFASSMTGKMSAAFKLMGVNIATSMKAMAASVKASFMGMLRSGQLAAIGIQAALAAATAGFMAAMNYVAKINQRIDETNEIGEGMQDDARKGAAARGYTFNRGGQLEKGGTGVSTQQEKADAIDDFRKQREELEKERQKFATEAYSPRSVMREAGDMTPDRDGRVGYSKMVDYGEEDQMKLDAMDARIANLKRQEEALANLTDAQLSENAAVKERIRLEQERAQYLADLPQKITEAQKSLEEAQKQADWKNMSPEQQRDKLLGDAGAADGNDINRQIADLDAANKAGTATDEQREKLLMLLQTKEQLLSIEKAIAIETERSAKREADLADQRKKRAEDLAQELAIKKAIAEGDSDKADNLREQQKKQQIQSELERMGFDSTAAAGMAQQSVDADREITNARQAESRQRNEQDIAAAIAKATGNTKEAEAIEREQRRQDIIKQQKDMGYSDAQATSNADTFLAAEEATRLQQQLNDAQKNIAPLFASSGTSVGAGGYSVGGGADPMIEENRRHTQLLEQIAANTRSARQPTEIATQLSNWEN